MKNLENISLISNYLLGCHLEKLVFDSRLNLFDQNIKLKLNYEWTFWSFSDDILSLLSLRVVSKYYFFPQDLHDNRVPIMFDIQAPKLFLLLSCFSSYVASCPGNALIIKQNKQLQPTLNFQLLPGSLDISSN